MNLKLKDYVAIAVVTVTSFPVLYLLMLFMTGTARIEFDPPEKKGESEKVEHIKQTARKDSLAAVNSRTFQALQKERLELQKERERLMAQQQRIDIFQQELENQQKALQQQRSKMESLVAQSDSLDQKKIRQLSKMYAAMKPAEAAQIIGTLQDSLAAKILATMNDDRQKARILSSLSREKANRISKILAP